MADKNTSSKEESGKQDIEQPKPVAPTPEEIQAIAENNAAEWFDNDRLDRNRKPEKPKEEKSVEQKAEEKPAEKPVEKPKDEKPAKPVLALEGDEVEQPEKVAEKPAKAAERAPLDDTELDEVADRLANRLTPAKADKPEEKPVDLFKNFGTRERAQLEALKYLSENDPKFKGRDLAVETAEFWRKEQDYIASWLKENKGEKFDPASSDHSDFYSRNEPAGITNEDIQDAQIDMRVEARVNDRVGKIEAKHARSIEERFKPIERERIIRENSSKIKASINTSVQEMVAQVVPDLIGEGGLTKEMIAKIETEDPVAMELMTEESVFLNARVRELEHLRHLGPDAGFNEKTTIEVNGQRIKPHAEIIETAVDIEENILAMPREKQVVDGRTFITRADRMERVEKIQSSTLSKEEKQRRLKALFERSWSIGLDDVREAFVAQAAARVKKALEIGEKRVKQVESKRSKSAENKETEKTTKAADKPASKSPASIAAQSDILHTTLPGGKVEKQQWEINASAMF